MRKILAIALMFILTLSCQSDFSREDDSGTLVNSSELTKLLRLITGSQSNNCVALQYPLAVFSYDSSFRRIETMVLNDDAEAFATFESLSSNEYYTIEYPVSLMINTQMVTLENNQQLQLAINAALASCD